MPMVHFEELVKPRFDLFDNARGGVSVFFWANGILMSAADQIVDSVFQRVDGKLVVQRQVSANGANGVQVFFPFQRGKSVVVR